MAEHTLAPVDGESSSPGSAHLRDPDPMRRRRTLSFVVLFVVYVLSLLIGYRYAVNTEANMWYLFQVANHTTMILDRVGHHADIESRPLDVPDTLARANLRKWRGAPELSAGETDSAPLGPYERWLYQAYRALEGGGSNQDRGPFIHFVAAEGLTTRINAANKYLAERRKMGAKQTELDAIAAHAKELRGQVSDLPAGASRNDALRDRSFGFVVVPDCGAIPSLSIFVAAVFAFPTTWLRRALGLLGGLPFLYGVNLARLSSLAYLAAYDLSPGRKWFTFFHEYVWQGVFIVFVVGVWLTWIEFVVKRDKP